MVSPDPSIQLLKIECLREKSSESLPFRNEGERYDAQVERRMLWNGRIYELKRKIA
jgi:hypothetical protein